MSKMLKKLQRLRERERERERESYLNVEEMREQWIQQ